MLDGVIVPLTKFCITAESKLSLYTCFQSVNTREDDILEVRDA